MTIDAAVWRDRHHQKREIALAWRVAALSRTKRLPALSRLWGTDQEQPDEQSVSQMRRRYEEVKSAVERKAIDVAALMQHTLRSRGGR